MIVARLERREKKMEVSYENTSLEREFGAQASCLRDLPLYRNTHTTGRSGHRSVFSAKHLILMCLIGLLFWIS